MRRFIAGLIAAVVVGLVSYLVALRIEAAQPYAVPVAGTAAVLTALLVWFREFFEDAIGAIFRIFDDLV